VILENPFQESGPNPAREDETQSNDGSAHKRRRASLKQLNSSFTALAGHSHLRAHELDNGGHIV